MNELEKRMKKLEGLAGRRNQEGQAVFKEGGLMVSKETEERVRSLEISVERQEREVRRKNIIVKGVEMQRNKEWSQEIERIWEKIGVEGGRRNMSKIGGIDKEGKGLVLIEMEGLEKKERL
ncbi:GSCOCG00012084001-RA-CDS [Cotesia congregata]|nr:GSCOCG00012084001-RA-CDS [Cotesia congregata]